VVGTDTQSLPGDAVRVGAGTVLSAGPKPSQAMVFSHTYLVKGISPAAPAAIASGWAVVAVTVVALPVVAVAPEALCASAESEAARNSAAADAAIRNFRDILAPGEALRGALYAPGR